MVLCIHIIQPLSTLHFVHILAIARNKHRLRIDNFGLFCIIYRVKSIAQNKETRFSESNLYLICDNKI